MACAKKFGFGTRLPIKWPEETFDVVVRTLKISLDCLLI